MKKEEPIEAIDLFITEQCNLNCKYCFHKQSNEVLSVEQGKKILDRMKQINPDSMKVSFFGGEPMLYPDTVLELAYYARTLWPDVIEGHNRVHKVALHISTNATVFDEELFIKFKALDLSVQVSFDGDRYTQELQRGGDFTEITNNIIKMLDIQPNTSVRMTFTPKTVGRLAINVQFVHELGFQNIMFHATMEDDWTDESIEMYRAQLSNLYHYRRYCHKRGDMVAILFLDKPLKVINDELPSERNFCEAGKSYIAILTNGDVYPCHRAASNRIFKLGNIFDEKRPYIRGFFLSINKETTGCWYKCQASRTCHTCIITQYQVNKDINKPMEKYCKICKMENTMAHAYLDTEIKDKQDRKLDAIASVISDLAVDNFILRQRLEKDKEK